MNAIKRFLIKNFFKMDKLSLLLSLHTYYDHFKESSIEGTPEYTRLIVLEELIDTETDNLLSLKIPKKSAESTTKVDPVDKSFIPPASKTTIRTEGAVKTPDTVTKTDVVVKGKENKIPDEAIVMVKPYYDCSIEQKKGVEPKKIKFDDCRIEFPTFIDDASAKQHNNLYPTAEELDLVLDEAWNMASTGKPNSAINEMLRKEIGTYYEKSLLKTKDDYYKISNAYSKLTKILRRGFGEGYEDFRIVVTRPSYTLWSESEGGVIIMTKDKDFSKVQVAEVPKTSEEAEASSEKKVEKPELKTVQTQKDNKPLPKEEVAPMDEEEQEKAETTPEDGGTPEAEVNSETDEEPKVENVEEPESDEGKAPSVNVFDSFNDIESLIYKKLRDGNAKASKEKDPKVQMVIKAEAREDAKLLIQSRFDAEEWAQKDDTGNWRPELMKYWNAILKEIGTRANATK